MNGIRYPWCSRCSSNFPMRDSLFDALERSGGTFYCPRGHSLSVSQTSIVSQLRSAEQSLSYVRDRLDRVDKQLSCSQGVIRRQRNRLIRGVCPYCGKSSSNMTKHIRERHGK